MALSNTELLKMAKRPSVASKGWRACGEHRVHGTTGMCKVWMHDEGIAVLSAVEWVNGQDHDYRYEYHVSVSYRRGVAPDEIMERVRADFDMGGADEDNHSPGVVRHLWLWIDAEKQDPCACVQDEDQVQEGDRVRTVDQ